MAVRHGMRLPCIHPLREMLTGDLHSSRLRRRQTNSSGARTALEVLEDRTLLASQGVTIITHGFDSDADTWVDAMADEVIARVAAETSFSEADVAKFELTINASSGVIVQESVNSFLTAASGQSVIRLDWGALSSDLSLSTLTVAERVADFVFFGNTWIVDGPLHLIGHSRGASLVNAIAAEFAERGVWVDQLTFLDAVPFGSDFPMNVPESVLFADGYWRTGGLFTPDGQAVAGAYNIELDHSHFEGGTIGYGGLSDVHSDVHLWYHGTVDNVDGFSDGTETVATADAAYWFLPTAYDSVDGPTPTGRDDTGYAFSRVVGFPRPVAGVTTDVGGTGTRTSVDWSAASWPNLLELTINASDFDFNIGELIPVDYYFQDADSNADLTLFFDVDNNPYNGNAVMAGGPLTQVGGITALTLDSEIIPTVGVAPGDYYVSARIVDAGGRQRWIYATRPCHAPSSAGDGDRCVHQRRQSQPFRDRDDCAQFLRGGHDRFGGIIQFIQSHDGDERQPGGATLGGNGTTIVTLNLLGLASPLPDGHYSLELPASATTPPLASTHTVSFWKLSGDIDGNAAVNLDDTVPLSLNLGTTGAAPFSDGDADGNGAVNLDDTVPLSLNLGVLLSGLGLDFGDAPEVGTTFATTLANDGARHIVTGNSLWLGADRDSEPGRSAIG